MAGAVVGARVRGRCGFRQDRRIVDALPVEFIESFASLDGQGDGQVLRARTGCRREGWRRAGRGAESGASGRHNRCGCHSSARLSTALLVDDLSTTALPGSAIVHLGAQLKDRVFQGHVDALDRLVLLFRHLQRPKNSSSSRSGSPLEAIRMASRLLVELLRASISWSSSWPRCPKSYDPDWHHHQ